MDNRNLEELGKQLNRRLLEIARIVDPKDGGSKDGGSWGYSELPSLNGRNRKTQIDCPFCLERFHNSQCPPRPPRQGPISPCSSTMLLLNSSLRQLGKRICREDSVFYRPSCP